MILDKNVLVEKLYTNIPSTSKGTYMPYSGFLYQGGQSAYVRMNIQPASPELTAMAEGEMFKTFRAFCTTSGIKDGMRITVSGTTDKYLVHGSEKFDYGSGQHYELTLIKDKP